MGFFGIGTGEILLIIVVALIIWGPRRLPEIARTMGKAMRTLRKASYDMTTAITREIDIKPDDQVTKKPANQTTEKPDHLIPGKPTNQTAEKPAAPATGKPSADTKKTTAADSSKSRDLKEHQRQDE